MVCGGFRLDKAAHNAACVVKIDQNEVDPNKNSFEIVDKMDSHVITGNCGVI